MVLSSSKINLICKRTFKWKINPKIWFTVKMWLYLYWGCRVFSSNATNNLDSRPINFLNLVYNLRNKLLALCVNQEKNKQYMNNAFRFLAWVNHYVNLGLTFISKLKEILWDHNFLGDCEMCINISPVIWSLTFTCWQIKKIFLKSKLGSPFSSYLFNFSFQTHGDIFTRN